MWQGHLELQQPSCDCGAINQRTPNPQGEAGSTGAMGKPAVAPEVIKRLNGNCYFYSFLFHEIAVFTLVSHGYSGVLLLVVK